MKRNIISLMAVLVMACAYAQNNAAATNLRREIAVNLAPAMRAAGAQELHIGAGAHNNGPAAHPKATPRTGSAPASRQLANNGGTAKIGDKMNVNGVEKILCEDGQLHVEGEILVDADGNLFEVKADGTIRFKSGPPPAPAPDPNKGNGLTMVAPLDAYYDTLSGGRVIFAGNLQIAGPAGGGATGSASGGADDIIIKTVNGVERAYIRTPNGLVPDDANSDMAILDAGKGRKFVMSEGQVEAGNMRNAYKFGMREAAGHTGQYYRRGAGVGTVLTGVASVLGVGGGASFVNTGAVGCNGPIVGAGGYVAPTFQGGYNPNPIGWDCWRTQQAQTFGGVWH